MEAGRAAEARPLTVRAAPEKSLRVLVVDDNADAADLLAEALGSRFWRDPCTLHNRGCRED